MQNRLPVVGAFVIGGLLLFAVGLFLIGDRRMLFNDTFEVYAEFTQIAGLQNGAKVRVAGLDAGEVETIHIPASPSAKFRVKVERTPLVVEAESVGAGPALNEFTIS